MIELEKVSFEKIVECIKQEFDFFKTIPSGFEELEDCIYKLIYKLALELLQNIINAQTDKIKFKSKLEINSAAKIRIYSPKDEITNLIVHTLFGEVKIPYKNYYNKSDKNSIKINCVNYIESDSVSPNVKKRIMEIAPFDFYEDSNNKLYKLANINLSASMLKRTVLSLGKENKNWVAENLNKKNSEPYSENVVKQAENIIISNDGGRFKEIHFEKNGRDAAKNPEWAEAKAGIVFAVDNEGEKTENPYYYGRFGENWHALESHLKYAVNRFGIQYCSKYETISDCGNGISQMYKREFNLPDNKIYFDVADYYHVTEHLWELGKIIYPNVNGIENASDDCKKFVEGCIEILLTKGGKEFLKFLKLESHDNKILKNNFDKYTSYFQNNFKRMDYHILLKNFLPIGSGEMEASIKKIINKRFKRNNIYWLKENADNLFNLGCTILNNQLDDFWEYRKLNLNSWLDFNFISKSA